MNDALEGAVMESVPTANLAFTVSAFDAVDGFDERYAYGSDVDFVWRLSDTGRTVHNIRAAVMDMDWGPPVLQLKRSWRYGRARARLIRLHSWGRNLRQVRSSPELVAYPAYIIGTIPTVVLSAALGAPLIAVAWGALMLVPLLKNRRDPQLRAVLTDHFVQGVAVIVELASGFLRPCEPVLHVPRDPGPYQEQLRAALAEVGVPSAYLDDPTGSKTLNILVSPFQLLMARLRGARVIHLHWVFGFVPNWATRVPGARRLFRVWFGVWLKTLQSLGLRLVYTAHNIVPHEQVFEDDERGRKMLTHTADAVIAHNQHAADVLGSRFSAAGVHVISQGTVGSSRDELPTRQEARAALGIDTDSMLGVSLGRIRPYKGNDTLITVAEAVPQMTLRIVGEGDDAHISELEQAAAHARQRGADIALVRGELSEHELDLWLAASDFVVYLATGVANSGALVRALRAGAVVLAAESAALCDIPADAVRTFTAGEHGAGLVGAIQDFETLEARERDAISVAASKHAAASTWDACAVQTRAVYEKALRRG
jgi:glycosyltransferase involved in cell wall biosynthesis